MNKVAVVVLSEVGTQEAFEVINEVRKTEVDLLDDYDDHPSLRNFIVNGFKVVTF